MKKCNSSNNSNNSNISSSSSSSSGGSRRNQQACKQALYGEPTLLSFPVDHATVAMETEILRMRCWPGPRGRNDPCSRRLTGVAGRGGRVHSTCPQQRRATPSFFSRALKTACHGDCQMLSVTGSALTPAGQNSWCLYDHTLTVSTRPPPGRPEPQGRPRDALNPQADTPVTLLEHTVISWEIDKLISGLIRVGAGLTRDTGSSRDFVRLPVIDPVSMGDGASAASKHRGLRQPIKMGCMHDRHETVVAYYEQGGNMASGDCCCCCCCCCSSNSSSNSSSMDAGWVYTAAMCSLVYS